MTFFEKVLIEYTSNLEENSYFICDCSPIFKSKYESSIYYEIADLAEEFIERHTEYINYTISLRCLFVTNFSTKILEREKIRIDFLQWCVGNKFKLSYE